MDAQLSRRQLLTRSASAAAAAALPVRLLAQEQSPALPLKETIAAIEAAAPALLAEHHVPGMALSLIHDGKAAWTAGFGVRNAASKEAVDERSEFQAASLSKPVFAYAVLKLCEQKKLDLDRPLSEYLPEPYIPNEPRLAKVTARAVLSHTSGLPNWRPAGKPPTFAFEPGERWGYSGEGYVYLQRVVERLSGKPLQDFLTEAVLRPFRMRDSGSVWRPEFDARAATGHDRKGAPIPVFHPTEANAAASLTTTARDYGLFLEQLLKPQRADTHRLRAETLKEMWTPQARKSESISWGLGWGLEKSDAGLSFWHWGDNSGFKNLVVGFPEQRRGIVVFTNGDNGLKVARQIVRLALGHDQVGFKWLYL